MKHTQRPSFTLIELMVVIAIIGILAAIGMVAIPQQQAKARNVQRLVNIQKLQVALERYYAKNGRYPNPIPPDYTSQLVWYDVGWEQLAAILVPKYLDVMPNDPLNTNGNFTCPATPTGACSWPGGQNKPGEAYLLHWHVIVSGGRDNYQHYLIMAGLEQQGASDVLKAKEVIIGNVRRDMAQPYAIINPPGKGNSVSWNSAYPHTNFWAFEDWWSLNLEVRSIGEEPLDGYRILRCGKFTYTRNAADTWDKHRANNTWYNLCLGNLAKNPTSTCIGDFPGCSRDAAGVLGTYDGNISCTSTSWPACALTPPPLCCDPNG